MSSNLARAPRRAVAASPRTESVERKLKRFRPEVQPRVRALAAHHPWIADLAVSFPALLFALAFPRRGVDRARAAARVCNGAPLAESAAAAGVPMWLRKFPPHAFARPIPKLPDNPEFRRQIANCAPRTWPDAPRWLDLVADTLDAGDETAALWIARETPPRRRRRRYARRALAHENRLVALWAWFSARPETIAHELIETKWTPTMSWKAARTAALEWREAISLRLYMGDGAIADTWLEPAIVHGFEFTPLRTVADLKAEAAAMRNCVRGYAADVIDNSYRIWSVRKESERVATLSLTPPQGGGAPFPGLHELAGPSNAKAAPEVWLAARAWMTAADPIEPQRLEYRRASFSRETWIAVWRPYWLAKRRIPEWLPLAPSETALYAL